MAAGASPIGAMMLQMLMQKIAGGQAGQGGPGGGGPGGDPGGGPGGPSLPGAGMSGQPGGGSPGGTSGMTVASPADQQGDELSKELSIMRVADPNMVSREIDAINSRISVLINHTNRSLPKVALGLSKALSGVHTALKAANEAAQAMAVAAPPINNSALPPGFNPAANADTGSPMGPGGPQ